ncbi:DUF808 domain-containing protein [Frigidibacter sp. MR17.24]|uniref:DUF808 domain-containing protein n=1 Tax=Frigidibacter sp. MR17.24 TaxID=3127345 RepID=UPI00301315A9
MSGLLALLDDVAGIAKIAATSVDDIAGQAMKSGAKAAGAVIDDAAVTPKYVDGLPAARELPIVGKIALGSLRNKILILLPIALLLSSFAPWAIMPLLMLGGAYLCFEGAEKVHHALFPSGDHGPATAEPQSAEHLEASKVAGAIKTDFILSAEIMTIALSAIPDEHSVWREAVVLGLVGIGITAVVYGGVALIVKADDIGLHLARSGRSGLVRGIGRGIVRGMPAFMRVLTVVGTAAMIWVGGSIIVHGLESFGLTAPGHWIEHMAEVASEGAGGFAAAVHWTVTAFFDGILGIILGFVLIPLAKAVARLRGGGVPAAH